MIAAGVISRKHLVKTLAISALIVVVALALDYIVNVWLMPGLTPYTPFGTLVIASAVAPVFTFMLIRQSAQLERAHEALAEEHEARLAADSANEAKSRFLATMSHELRTPLNAIIGYAEIIEEESSDHASNAEDSRRVQRSAHHLLSLINDILDQARIESGKMQLNPALTPLGALLSDVAEAVRGAAAKKGVELALECDPDIGMAYLDAQRFKQCLLNLSANAVKFTRAGKVTLRLTADELRGEPALRFEAIDTGIGISGDALARLFRPFVQANGAVTREFGGTGLGLAITKTIADAMGGDIRVTSKVGSGSSFTLIVPRVLRSERADTVSNAQAA